MMHCLRSIPYRLNIAVVTFKNTHKLPSASFHGKKSQVTKRKKKGIWSWSKEPEEEKLKITRPGDCEQRDEPLLEPGCKVAVILGGSRDVGLSAADCLLYHGAKGVILADESAAAGNKAVQQLCEMYGRDRAQFVLCDANSACKLETVVESVRCKHKHLHILLNNPDTSATKKCSGGCSDIDDDDWSKTRRAIEVGVKLMGKHNGGVGGVVINVAAILGFMGWPEEPVPVYCSKEPVVETSQDLAKIYPFEKTGVRIVTLLRASKGFENIGLPDFPASNFKPESLSVCTTPCTPVTESKIGKAMMHVMAKAKNGSTWLVETAVSPRDQPRLIHFPSQEGQKIDPKVYNETPCPPAFENFCAATLNSKCTPITETNCLPKKSEK